jgi:hypothetical protein
MLLLVVGRKAGLNFPKEIGPVSETFARRGSSIRVQPGMKLFRVSQSNKKSETPRWQPRGDDTQVFPAVSPGRGGVFRARVLARALRVNSACPVSSLLYG